MTPQSPTQRAHTSPSIEEALAALGSLEYVLKDTFAHLRFDGALGIIRSALTSAAQEREAWREIEAWLASDEGHNMNMTVSADGVGLTLANDNTAMWLPSGPTRLAAIVAAGEWCRAERGKAG